MIGAIVGDIVGSRFEFNNVKKDGFKLFTDECDFTDDTICTVAIMDAILNESKDYTTFLRKWGRKYPNPMGSYGGSFGMWLRNDNVLPYYSYGNGAAMRVSPVAWSNSRARDVLTSAIETANVSHNHPEGIKGAMATALAVYFLRTRKTKEVLSSIECMFYDPKKEYIKGFFDETCQGTVPVAIRIVGESNDFENAIRKAMLWGGDSDTLGAIVGSMAEALYGVPEWIKDSALAFLPFEMKTIISDFYKKFVL